MDIKKRESRLFAVKVSPPSNEVHEGESARFECDVVGGGESMSFTWNTHYSILKEKRFRLEDAGKVMHVLDIQSSDHNRTVTCTATSNVKYSVRGSGKILVLPSKSVTTNPRLNEQTTTPAGHKGAGIDQDVSRIQEKGHNAGGLPPVTIAGVALMAGALVVVIIAIATVVYVLKKAKKENTKRAEMTASGEHIQRQPGVANALYDSNGLRPVAVVKAATLDVVYDSPITKHRGRRSLSEGDYDVPSPPNTPKRPPDLVFNSHDRIYTPRYMNQKQTTLHNVHKSLTSLDAKTITNENDNEEGDLYENMYQGIDEEVVPKTSSWSTNMSNNMNKHLLQMRDTNGYDHITRSNPGSLSDFAIPRSRSTGCSSQYSNLSSHLSHSYDNLSIMSQGLPVPSDKSVEDRNSTENSQSYENQDVTKDRQPLFELCEDPNLKYASIYIDNENISDHMPSSPNKPKTSYAKIRHIIKVLRTRKGTDVEIVDC